MGVETMVDETIMDGPVCGRYGTCERCQAVDVAVFRRDVFGHERVNLCRRCIADLDLGRNVAAFDVHEPDPPVADPCPRDVPIVVGIPLVVVFLAWTALMLWLVGP